MANLDIKNYDDKIIGKISNPSSGSRRMSLKMQKKSKGKKWQLKTASVTGHNTFPSF